MSVPNPVDVIREALLHPIPCPHCGRTVPCRCMPDRKARLDWQANHIADVLTSNNLLAFAGPSNEPTVEDYEAAAQWLAEESRHPRYGGNGWRKVLESEADVGVAYTAALKAYGNPTSDQISHLGAAKDLLERYIRSQRAADDARRAAKDTGA